MAITGNFRGTSQREFKIGKNGPTLHTTSLPVSAASGDYYLDKVNKEILVYNGTDWEPLSDLFSSLNVGDFLIADSGNITISAPMSSNSFITAESFIGDGSGLTGIDGAKIANTVFVQTTGNDLLRGDSWGDAVFTIERALEIAWERAANMSAVPTQIASALSIQTAAADLISDASGDIVVELWDALVAGGYTATWGEREELLTKRDAGTFIQAMIWVLQSADEKPMLDFARGLFTTTGDTVFSSDKLAAFIFSFNTMRDSMLAVLPSPTYDLARIMVTDLVAALNSTLTTPVLVSEPLPTVIQIGPGRYQTQGHLDMPDSCVIKSTHRTTFIEPVPGFEERNVFRMGSGCFIEGLMFEKWRLDSLTNPTEGFAVCFRPGAVIRRAPYVHKIAVRSPPTWTSVAPPLDRENANPLVGIGAGVVLADGAVCSQYSIYPNIMTWGATPVTHNGIGYCAKNGALINAVNAVSLWCHKHFMALSGGQIILSSCSTQFGDFTMVSSGTRQLVLPETITATLVVDTAAANIIISNTETIIDDMWTALDTTVNPNTGDVYTLGWDAEDELYTRRDAGTFLQSIIWVLQSANETPMEDFARGLFDTQGNPVFSADKLDAFIFAFNTMRDSILALLPSPTYDTSRTIVTELVAALNSTVTAPVQRTEPSIITAIGHTWSAIMAGVALTKIPPAFNQALIEDSILELDQGVVIASGQDDQGSALFIGGMKIDADTGELSGPPFDSAVNRIATRAAIARSF